MEVFKRIIQYYKENHNEIKDRIIRLTKEMVKEKTVNVISEKLSEHPYLKIRGEEYRVANIVKREFQTLEIPYEEFSRMEGRPNVIGKIGNGINDKSLLIPAHMDIVPAGEGWDSDPFDVTEKEGKLYGRGTIIGKQAHGSTPERGINAVYMMARLINEIEKLTLEHQIHDVLGHPSLNLGEIHGGAAPNIVPGTCSIYLDLRTVPGMTKDGVIEQLQSCTNKVENGKFEIEVMSRKEPHGIDPNNDVVKAIQKNVKDILGLEPEPYGQGGYNYAKTLNLGGVLAVGWGPGDDEAFHVANEFVEIQELIDFSLLTCLISLDLLE